MKIVVTGGAGFIGSNFIIYWLDKYSQDKIVNLDKLTYAGNLENLKSVQKNKNYQFVKGDICDPQTALEVTKEADVIVHFAAESHVDRSILDPAPFITTNILGTYNLLEASLKNNVKRFHHISTDEVFGALELDSKDKFNENTTYDPRSPYSASKASSDHLVRAYFHTYKLPITISNCSNNFGPYQFPEKLIPLSITNLLEGKKVPIYGDGKYTRDWLYVLDHCKAIDLIINKGRIGETYCIGGSFKDISNKDLVEIIIEHMGLSRDMIEYVKDRPGHDRKYAINWSKINKELGWKPEHDVEYYIIQTIKWYKNNIKWWKDVKNGSYKQYYKQQYG